MRHKRWIAILATFALLAFSWAALADDPITITIGIAETHQPAGLTFIEEVLIPKFEAENPGIRVEMDIIRWSYDTYVTRYIAGEAPDAFQMGGDRVGTYVPMLYPLDEYTDPVEMADYPPVLIDGWTLDGHLYGIPWSMPIRTLVFRTDHFMERGLDPAAPPATWDDLIDYGKRLTLFDPNGTMTRQGLDMSDHWLNAAGYVYQAGADYMNEDRTEFTFGSEAAQEAAAFMRDVVEIHQISAPQGLDLGDIREERTSMEVRQATILNEEDYRDTIGAGPALRHKVQTLVAYANGWGITNTSAHKDAAWKWIEFATRIDNMVDYSNASFVMPPRMSVVNYEPWSNDPRFLTVYENTMVAKGMPFESPHIDQVRKDFIQPAFKKIMYEGASLSELVEAERLANAYLADQLSKE